MNLIETFRQSWPEVFPAREIDQRSHNTVRWRTLQNKRCSGDIPHDCFQKMGSKKILLLRDPFLNWLEGQLTA